MTDNFKIIYQLLSAFERALDVPDFDVSAITAESLHISETRRCKYLQMLVHAGYITGIQFRQNLAGGIDIIADNPLITIQGLEYLSENSIMQRIYKTVKGIADVIT